MSQKPHPWERYIRELAQDGAPPLGEPSCGHGCDCPNCVECVVKDVLRAIATLPQRSRLHILDRADDVLIADLCRLAEPNSKDDLVARRRNARAEIGARLTPAQWATLRRDLARSAKYDMRLSVAMETGRFEFLRMTPPELDPQFMQLFARALALSVEALRDFLSAAVTFDPSRAS